MIRPAMRDTQHEHRVFKSRVVLAGLAVLVGFAIVLLRAGYLQVVQNSHFQKLSESNRIAHVPIAPNRGIIIDRNGVILAENRSAYTLEIIPSKVANLDAVIDELSSIVEINARDRKRFKRLLEESKNLESLPIKSRLTEDEVAKFSVNRFRFPGVEIKARLFRQYPMGETAAHAIGHIGRINDNDIKRFEEQKLIQAYKGTDHIGKLGLEASYERELHGIAGTDEVEVDAAGRAVRSLSRTEPIAGNNLILSLDIKLQKVAEAAFGEEIGALIAIQPQTGDILALVSRPNFDPNLFIDGIDPQSWDALNTSPNKPMVNRALQGVYPPGSTIKPFMALAGLAYGKRTPEWSISDPGYFSLAGVSHRWRDWKKSGHGIVDLHRSIVVSCDTYYYSLGNELGIDAIHTFMKQFGFGEKTGVDIDGERSALLPSQEWKQRRQKQKWYAGDTISVSIGQGLWSATPIQLAASTAALANNGTFVRPQLVRAVQDAKTQQVRLVQRSTINQTVPIQQEHLELIKTAMADVMKAGGTGAKAGAGAEYTIAGKTGTAQVRAIKQGETYNASKTEKKFRDHALFVAFAPVDNPKIALAVLVENGGGGGSIAAPIAREVFDYALLGKVKKQDKSVDPDAEIPLLDDPPEVQSLQPAVAPTSKLAPKPAPAAALPTVSRINQTIR